jgi:hypothetical protein
MRFRCCGISGAVLFLFCDTKITVVVIFDLNYFLNCDCFLKLVDECYFVRYGYASWKK